MVNYLLLVATIILACVIFNKISSKIGVPMLLAFILLGMFFGSDGVVKIPFDNYEFAEQICSVALIFIMFYGGFGTNWNEAKPVAFKAVVLSSVGTAMTAGLVGLFCYYIVRIDFLESFLIGAVISSTDAASVFSILRSQRLNLRYNTASLLEIESGSNDPFSYMLTVIILSLMQGRGAGAETVYLIFAQICYGLVFGAGIAVLTIIVMKKVEISSAGFDAIFIVAIALLAYAIPSYFGGNGYLSVYITGIILGNRKIKNKQSLVNFFDGVTGLMQMLLFFLLGLLAFPSQIPHVAIRALVIAVFLTFVARPIVVCIILSMFKSKLKQQILVSWAGMRGAASIVFAIMTVTSPAMTNNDIYHIVFFIVLFSILLQGTLIPFLAKRLEMTDDESDVMKTFTDYIDEVPVQFIQCKLHATHKWVGKMISDIQLPPESLLVLLIRQDEKIVPNGSTVLKAEDTLILSGKATQKIKGVNLYEKEIHKEDSWVNMSLADIPSAAQLIIMIRRNDEVIIPTGTSVIEAGDVLVINECNSLE